jgi:putative PIN family toxin of toxin-antitoxin system
LRVLFDTVVLVRGLINPGSRWGRLLFEHSSRYTWIVSPSIVDEYLEVLRRPRIVRKYRDVETRNLAAMLDLIATAVVVQPVSIPAICRDPQDDKFLAAAMAGSARFIVTEDLDLLDIGIYEKIEIISAETFLLMLEAAEL